MRWIALMTVLLAAGTARAQVTDLDVRNEPPLPALPAAGGTLVDPTFGTTILRVTDATTLNGKSCGTAYAYWPTFNRDTSRLFALCGTTGVLFDFTPGTLGLANRRPLFAAPPPGGSGTVTEDSTWSGLDPDILFTHDATRLWAYDVTTTAYTLVKDLAAIQPNLLLHQMSRSIDDDVFAFTTRNAGNGQVAGYVVYRRSTDSYPVQVATTQLDEVQLDKSGQYLLVKTGQSSSSGTPVRNRVIDTTTGALVAELTDGSPDFAVGHSDNGTGIVVGYDRWNNQLTGRALATPHTLATVQPYGDDWQAQHVSMLADDERWATVGIYRAPGGSSAWAALHQEIYQVATDGSARVRRLAHHRSDYSSYWDSPRANISRDARFVAFTSNWGGSSRQDLFVLAAPATGMCGDGTLDFGEVCDDANDVSGDGCDANCTPTACGNGVVTAGEACDDGNPSGGDCCDATCAIEPAGESCDDGELCTGSDACDGGGLCAGAAEPAAGCHTAALANVTVKGGTTPSLAWKWSRGSTTLEQLGDPVAGTTSYGVCVYDETSSGWALRLRARVPAGGTCAGKPCWTLKNGTLTYKNKTAAPDGVTAARFKASASGTASLDVKGRGAKLTVGTLPFAQQTRVTTQLRSSAGECWSSELLAPASANTIKQFKDRVR